jgi:hypothetical protein
MIFAKSFAEVGADRFEGKLFNGSMYARTNYLGSDTSHRDTPQALLVEQSAQSHIPAHFHGIDQYQLVVKGGGSLGKHDVGPVCVHFAKAYTGYGPVVAGDDGLFYFTLRAQSEPGAFFFPEGRKHQKPAKRRNLTEDLELVSSASPMTAYSGPALEEVFQAEAEGLAAWTLRLGANQSFTGPDPALGGGQYYVVLNGALCRATGTSPGPDRRRGRSGSPDFTISFLGERHRIVQRRTSVRGEQSRVRRCALIGSGK